MKVLVTGHLGYIGAHLIPLLQAHGHNVSGCDLGLFKGNEWEKLPKADTELNKDFRKLEVNELAKYDCVMHLAAISNDAMGNINPEITFSNNRAGSIELARKSKEAGVTRFLFSSSCSIYGKGLKMNLDETDDTDPLTPYAISKVDTENELKTMASDDFSPVCLRNATAYGYSPSLRIDLVVNNLLGCAVARGDIRIESDGQSWRPLIHCKDIARAFLAILETPREVVHNQVINIGANTENYQVKDVAKVVKSLLPKSNVVFTNKVGKDPRNYKIKFDKLNRLLPDFKLKYTLQSGMNELFIKYQKNNFNLEDFEGDRYIRLKALKKTIGLL